MSDSLQPHGLYNPWNSPGQNSGVGSLSLLREIFSTQGSNPDLLHYRQILYQLSYEGLLISILINTSPLLKLLSAFCYIQCTLHKQMFM